MTTQGAMSSTESVTSVTEVPELHDKPASPEPSSPPATPATLSVNEDTMEEADESADDAQSKKDGTSAAIPEKKEPKKEGVLKSSSRKRSTFTYNPNKVTLRFIFANRDGVSVTLDCEPADTVREVKGALLSAWPKGSCADLSYIACVCYSVCLFVCSQSCFRIARM